MQSCSFCGSKFGDYRCYFCEKSCCTSCMTDDKSRCRKCYLGKKRLGLLRVLKKNKVLLGFICFVWFYAVYPGPFIPGLDPTFYYATLIAAILFMIPAGLMLFFWSRNPPSSDIKRR